jgi:regulator of RNase E activity RraA
MPIDEKLLAQLAEVDTPTICNALEVVTPERRGFGYTTKPLVAAYPAMKPIVGFARTGTLRAKHAPTRSARELKELRLAYYEYVTARPGEPTITVLQDLDPEPGYGAFWGEVNTAVHKGLGCLGCITNGSIRDLDMIAPDFQLLAGVVGPSHAFVHIEQYDIEVNVHGMQVSPGDLIHADRHGAVVIPRAVAEKVPAAVDLCGRKEAPVLKMARAPGFSVDKLRQAMGEAEDIH